MASGPDHYKAAESLLYGDEEFDGYSEPRRRADELAAAQVHATLALAAATALRPTMAGEVYRDKESWHAVTRVAADDPNL